MQTELTKKEVEILLILIYYLLKELEKSLKTPTLAEKLKSVAEVKK